MTAPDSADAEGHRFFNELTRRVEQASTGRFSVPRWRWSFPCPASSEWSLRIAVAARATADGSQPWRLLSGARSSASSYEGCCTSGYSHDRSRSAAVRGSADRERRSGGWPGVAASDERQRMVRQQQGARAGEPRDGATQSDGAHRALRLWQIHVPEDPQSYARADPERRPVRIGQPRRLGHLLARSAGDADASPDRHGVSAAEPLSLHDHRPECAFGTSAVGHKGAEPRPRWSGSAWTRRPVEGNPQPTQRVRSGPLRWSAPTPLHCPLVGRPSPGAAHGRALLGA